MSKKSSSSNNLKGKSPIEVLVAKYGFWGTITTALLSLAGVILAAYFGYEGIKAQFEIPIHATQTAEAKFATFTLTAENSVEVVFSLPASFYTGSAKVTITTESGLTVFSFDVLSGTTQKVVLPPGNYKYEITTRSLVLPTGQAGQPSYGVEITNTETFTVELGLPTEIILNPYP